MTSSEERIPADEYARRYGWRKSAVIHRIQAGIYDGGCEDGTWYVVQNVKSLTHNAVGVSAHPDIYSLNIIDKAVLAYATTGPSKSPFDFRVFQGRMILLISLAFFYMFISGVISLILYNDIILPYSFDNTLVLVGVSSVVYMIIASLSLSADELENIVVEKRTIRRWKVLAWLWLVLPFTTAMVISFVHHGVI